MPHLTRPLSVHGPIVELAVGVSLLRIPALKAAGQTPPPPVVVRALIDTGASSTVIHGPSIQSLNLEPTGTTAIHTPSTAGVGAPCFLYDVWLAVLDNNANFLIGNRPIIASDLTGTGIQALLGRDVLANCLLIYDGSAQKFTLSF